MMKKLGRLTAILIAALIVFPQLGLADGMIIPPIPRTGERPIILGDMYSVKYHRVYVDIQDQAATTTVEQAFVNETGREIEVVYVFPLPKGAQVQKLSLYVGDKELTGRLLTKEEARREYESIVRSRRDPALLEYLGNDMFKSSVFPLPPGGERRVKLVYSELLRMEGDRVEYVYPLNTEKFSKKPLTEVEVHYDLKTITDIKNVYSPSHDAPAVWSGDRHVTGKWADENVRPEHDFRLFWTLSKSEVGATIFTYRPDGGDDGYFLLLASPEIGEKSDKVINKDVIIVLDHSGSMGDDNKMEQAKSAAAFIVRNLQDGDKFNVIVYDDVIDPLWKDLKQYNQTTRKEALDFIEKTVSNGSTDIHGALTTAMKMIPVSAMPHYIIFLTDGLPTAGVSTDPAKINEDVKKANVRGARLFAFGVGYDVNSILLDRLGVSNHGLSEYVKPDESIEGKVSRFYSKIQSPALTDISLDFGAARILDTFPKELPDLFRGEQLIYMGRYRSSGAVEVKLSGTALDKKSSFTYKFNLPAKTNTEDFSFVARLWAQKKIGWLIEQIRLQGEKKEYVDQIVKLSIRYGILTEYTSFLADENVNIHDKDNYTKAEDNINRRRGVVTGAGGVNQSMQSNSMQKSAQAPSAAQYYDEKGDIVQVTNVKVIGSKTFYLKKGVWIDSEYDEKMPLNDVKQMSDDHINLANQSPTQAKYITFNPTDSIIVVIDGKAYKISPDGK